MPVALPFFIDGAWVAPGPDTARVVVGEAATGASLGCVALAGPAEISRAADAARRALTGEWGRATGEDRAQAMHRLANELSARARTTAALVSRENGMPIRSSTTANGYAPGVVLRYYARLAAALDDEVRRGRLSTVTVRRVPVGVVAAVTPWTYPQALAATKIAPALAAGCTVVLRPDPHTALDAYVWAEAALAAGLPPGVINIVPARGESTSALVAHPDVDLVAFNGTTADGRAVGETCGRLLRPAVLGLGGRSAAVVAEDADLEAFFAALPDHSLPGNGQASHAVTRILAPRARYAEIVDGVTATVASLRVGDPLDVRTFVGPLVGSAHRERVLGFVDAARRDGARLTTGGRVPPGLDHGWFLEPTVLADVDNASPVAQEDVLGPVLCVIPYDGEDEAIALANASAYGLGGTVWTTDLDRGRSLAARIRAGGVGINHYVLDPVGPFGGLKASGLGRELGPEGLDPYLARQSVYSAPVSRRPAAVRWREKDSA